MSPRSRRRGAADIPPQGLQRTATPCAGTFGSLAARPQSAVSAGLVSAPPEPDVTCSTQKIQCAVVCCGWKRTGSSSRAAKDTLFLSGNTVTGRTTILCTDAAATQPDGCRSPRAGATPCRSGSRKERLAPMGWRGHCLSLPTLTLAGQSSAPQSPTRRTEHLDRDAASHWSWIAMLMVRLAAGVGGGCLDLMRRAREGIVAPVHITSRLRWESQCADRPIRCLQLPSYSRSQ